ncbi:protein disulfide oxidoreductase [Mannheimia sp. AT1]|uniref:Protein disulfide oxidoreductase n=1 Tax=Mannheimia cairinae TaxID=3025936 RepID=A0ABT5MS63_9PAST|nr:protein disulfide oxidoreductase [Mannheimia cairinae]MDD0825019.1 protein disulfide oxidoreductase [Mannheimia cairinae]MDD0827257.1 protein disulfide oxidoreductase [Mannheimia cairinae]
MNKKKSLITRFLKNIFIYGGLFIIVSFLVDWYRAPTAPAQFGQQVQYDIQNQPKIIAQLSHNKPMLLYFWGSWCHYCKVVSPNIQQFANEGMEVLSVALKSGSDMEVKNYLDENGYAFPTLNDPMGEFSQGWNIQATPTILIIKDSKILHHTTGYTSYWGLKIRLWLSELLP